MADKKDNRTEKWLQDYARRRREQQGPVPEMHDATRRLLQGEVRRTWGQPAPETETTGGWEAWLLRFATGTVVVVALALGVWVTTDRAKNTGGAMKMTKAEPIRPSEKQRMAGVSNAEQDKQSSERVVAGKADKAVAKLAENDSVPATKSARKFSAGAFNNAPNEAARVTANSILKFEAPQRDVYSNMRRSFNQQVSAGQDLDSEVSRANLARSAASKDLRNQSEELKKVKHVVMQNFEVVRDGETIQVRDEDGSVYKGHVILATAIPLLAAKGLGGGSPVTPKPAPTSTPGKGLPGVVNTPNKPATPPVRPPKLGSGGLRPALPVAVPGKYNPAVPNDNVETPLSIAELNTPLVGHNMHATRQSGRENLYHNFHGRSVWYLFKAPDTGVATISTRGSNIDTTLGIFAGETPGTIQLIPDVNGFPAWNNDQPNAPWSKVSFECVAGSVYRVAVDGVSGTTGQIKLTARLEKASASDEVAIVSRANAEKALFYFQVEGNSLSGQPMQFEGFVRNPPAGMKELSKLKDLEGKRGRLVAAPPLRIQGRANYGGKQLTVDAFTASIVPVPAASKVKAQRRK